MRTEQQIRHRLKQRRFRHEKKYLASMLARTHANCRHNVQCETSYSTTVCVCNHPDNLQEGQFDVSVGRLTAKQPTTKLPVCDKENNQDRAHECGLFETRQDKDTLKAAFRSQMEALSQDLDKLSAHYPDLAQLVWMLKDDHDEVVWTDQDGRDTVVEWGDETDGLDLKEPSLAEVLDEGNTVPGTEMVMVDSDTETVVPEGVELRKPLQPPKFIDEDEADESSGSLEVIADEPRRSGVIGWLGAVFITIGRWLGG